MELLILILENISSYPFFTVLYYLHDLIKQKRGITNEVIKFLDYVKMYLIHITENFKLESNYNYLNINRIPNLN